MAPSHLVVGRPATLRVSEGGKCLHVVILAVDEIGDPRMVRVEWSHPALLKPARFWVPSHYLYDEEDLAH